jgi:hypothetical protein
VTSGSLAVVDALNGNPSKALEVAVLVAANLVATGVRFLLMRVWVFRAHRTATTTVTERACGRRGGPNRRPAPDCEILAS